MTFWFDLRSCSVVSEQLTHIDCPLHDWTQKSYSFRISRKNNKTTGVVRSPHPPTRHWPLTPSLPLLPQSLLEPFSKLLSFVIQYGVFSLSYLVELCGLCYKAFNKVRNVHVGLHLILVYLFIMYKCRISIWSHLLLYFTFFHFNWELHYLPLWAPRPLLCPCSLTWSIFTISNSEVTSFMHE